MVDIIKTDVDRLLLVSKMKKKFNFTKYINKFFFIIKTKKKKKYTFLSTLGCILNFICPQSTILPLNVPMERSESSIEKFRERSWS